MNLNGELAQVAQVAIASRRNRVMLAASIEGAETESEISTPAKAGEISIRMIETAIRASVAQLQAGHLDGIIVTVQVRHTVADDAAILAAMKRLGR